MENSDLKKQTDNQESVKTGDYIHQLFYWNGSDMELLMTSISEKKLKKLVVKVENHDLHALMMINEDENVDTSEYEKNHPLLAWRDLLVDEGDSLSECLRHLNEYDETFADGLVVKSYQLS